MTSEEYTRHIDWSLTACRRRARQTAHQAASILRSSKAPKRWAHSRKILEVHQELPGRIHIVLIGQPVGL